MDSPIVLFSASAHMNKAFLSLMTHPWHKEHLNQLYELPFIELIQTAQSVHQQHFDSNEIELCTLLSIKTGACPEDCAYCPQSAHYQTHVEHENLLSIDQVVTQAQAAKQAGATRFCMGAAWRHPPKKALPIVIDMIKAVKNVGLETCATLGMLDAEQAHQLKAAGLDFYNHNLDTSPRYYQDIITTRTYQDRLETLAHLHAANIHICCGGIIGMGESREDRIELLLHLANLPTPPRSVPINKLVPIPGTPLAELPPIDNFEFIRTVAVTRIILPTSMIRLSAGRDTLSEEMHTLCFMAGANSIFFGDTLLTVSNTEQDKDIALLKKLKMKFKTLSTSMSN
jgi:biotin synthase